MQFVDGAEILDKIAEMGKYCEADAQYIFKQVLEGLAYLHDEKVCHRDIKPSNLLITEKKELYIADFNVAKDCKGAEPIDKDLITNKLEEIKHDV